MTNINEITKIEAATPLMKYISLFMEQPSNHLIHNVETSFHAIKIDDLILPFTINITEYESSYVCSPYNALISYSKEELCKFNNKPLQLILAGLINMLSNLLKYGDINKNIHMNNLLLSTNLYPKISKEQLSKITSYCTEKYPDHLLAFRSLNDYTQTEMLHSFKDLGFMLIPSRQVYIFDKSHTNYMKCRDTKQDFKLLKTTHYQIVQHDEITKGDYPRIVQLYNMLYLDKYSKHNPQFNEEFFRQCHQNKFLNMIGLRDKNDHKLYAILGYYEINNVMTTPLFGYDTNIAQQVGLYRMITALLLQEASRKQMILHSSSGAGRFKFTRGATPYTEYTAVYCKHLSKKRIFLWQLMKFLLTKIALPLMRKYEL